MDLCNFVSLFNILNIYELTTYFDLKYYFPEKIEIIEGEDIAYNKIGVGEIERYSFLFRLCYGKKLKLGVSYKGEYYKLKLMGLESCENLFSIFSYAQVPFGIIYGEYSSNNEWNIAYLYEFCLYRIRNGFEFSTISFDNSLAFKLKIYLSTFKRDLKIGLSYFYSPYFNNSSPFEFSISKLYDKFEVGFVFSPSDIVDSSFRLSVSYNF
ncbi:MAG: hypothetical protein ACP5Q5_02200 [Brevinematia bacterium]